jgi:hypothetical protein
VGDMGDTGFGFRPEMNLYASHAKIDIRQLC